MTTEEKAKAYDEALKDIKVIYPNLCGDSKLAVEHAFPELAESEDERIRKDIIKKISWIVPDCQYAIVLPREQKNEWLAWLKKQRKLFESGRGLYYYDGEKTTYMGYPATEENPYDFAISQQEKQKEQKPLSTEETELNSIAFLEQLGYTCIPPGKEQRVTEWSEEDERMLSRCVKSIECSKEFCDTKTFKEAKDVEEDWLRSLPERFNLQPKQEWSKDDEANLDYLIDFCNSYYNGNTRTLTESIARTLSGWLYRVKSGEISLPKSRLDEKDETTIHLACEFIRHHSTNIDSIGGIDCSELIKRLKSFRPQPHWKPSEEQMEALKNARYMMDQSGDYFDTTAIIGTLINDLKKLL